jgi:hypothetical protein
MRRIAPYVGLEPAAVKSRAGRERGAMSKSTFPRDPQLLARWIEIVGASAPARRSTLPKDRPVYRI